MSVSLLKNFVKSGPVTCKCIHVQPSLGKLRSSVLYLPYNSIKSSSWKFSRWPGKRNLVAQTLGTQSEDIYALNRLLKPLIFTFTVSGVSIAGASIWQYENVRRQAVLSKGWWSGPPQPKYGQWRQHLNKFWNNLNAGDKIFVPICAINLLVFLAWRVPRWQPVMTKYFTSGLDSKSICWPMLLSVFSHYSLLHVGANMFVLHSFTPKAVNALGKEQFLAMYLSGGMVSSFTSYLYKAVMKCPNSSLGASGAVMCVLGYFCLKYPESKLSIVFLPQFPFDALTGLKALLCLDSVGCILRWALFDHAAHLGGTLFGIAWFNWGHDYLWRKREPLITAWHNLRGPVK